MKECTLADKPELHYNFVFCFAHYDYWEAILGRELYDCENVHIYDGAFEGGILLNKLFHLHWSYRINAKINLPFKRIWFRKMYRQKFPNNLPLCFVFMSPNYILHDGGWCKYLHKKSKENRQVVIHSDLISKKCRYDYQLVRDKIDLATTYDLAEAQKFNIHYFQETTYSKLIPEPKTHTFKQDVYFLGAAKDRLPKIMATYEKLRSMGVKCKFMIAGVPETQRVEAEGIEYTDGISYRDNLQNIIESKCVLELIQGGSCDITTRALEAIAYRRKFVTDCQICDTNYFNSGQLHVFTDPETLDPAFFAEPYTPENYPPQLDMNPLRRLYDIQEQLEAHYCE